MIFVNKIPSKDQRRVRRKLVFINRFKTDGEIIWVILNFVYVVERFEVKWIETGRYLNLDLKTVNLNIIMEMLNSAPIGASLTNADRNLAYGILKNNSKYVKSQS